MVYINSGQSCNTFWQVGSSATLGSTTSFQGNILALDSITLNTGVIVNGRLLARTGAVTLYSNTISKTTCTTPAPTSTPVPTLTSSPPSTSSSSSSDSYCPPITDTVVTPMIIESKRIDQDSVYLTWGPYSGTDTFNVEYGFENGKWLFNTDVTGFSVTINDLPSNQPIWVRVAARNDCQIGVYGEPLFIGSPKLPNTGFAPSKNSLFVFLNQIKNWFY